MKAYHDPAGRLTVGLGHLCTALDHYVLGSIITLEHAHDLYLADVSAAAAQVLHLVKVPLNDNQFAALIDFTFNEGSGRLMSSTLLRVLNQGNYTAAATHFAEWNKGVNPHTGQLEVLPGLVTRRAKEAELFLATS